MDVLTLSRIQFAFTIAFHYIYPPISVGLSVIIVIMGLLFLKTQNPLYKQMMRFWVRLFGLVFAIGVATGVVMEFEFGTNWATYSRYVGDVFGSALASEGIFAFFLESGFLGILLFGWDKVSMRIQVLSAALVSIGAHFSAVWIVAANSWMQTPAGFRIEGEGLQARAVITDFWAMVINYSTIDRLSHTFMGCWQAGAWFVVSVSAFYLLKKRHIEFAQASLKIALGLALVSSLGQLWTGHHSAVTVSKTQPAKLAAFEGHFEDQVPADTYVFGWVKNKEERTVGVKIPGFLSYLIHGDAAAPVTGLKAFKPMDRPPVNFVFQTYHIMVIIGSILILLSVLGVFFWTRGTLFKQRWLLWSFVFAVLGPQIANQAGWFTAEVGRQPWVVYNLLRTSDGLSKVVKASAVLSSLIMFSFVYLLLFLVFIYLLDYKIRQGPEEEPKDENPTPGKRARSAEGRASA